MSDILTYNPWHGDPANAAVPLRPSLAQLGGGAFVDDQDDPPDLDTMPSAEMENVNEKTLEGVSATCPVAVFSVSFSGGTPSLSNLATADTSLVTGDITITDNATGDTSITWAADTFPVAAAQPFGLTINDDIDIDRMRAFAITNGIQIKTFLGAAATDAAFTVALM